MRKSIRRFRLVVRLRLAGVREIWIRLGSSDIAVLYEIFGRGEYAQHVEQIERHMGVPPNPIIVDLGANVGLAAVYFQLRYPGAALVCVEPEDDNFRYLERNAATSLQQSQSMFVKALIGADEGTGYIQSGNGEEWSFTLSREVSERSTPTPIIDLKTLLKRLSQTQVDILKCDIEGSEAELMQQISTWGTMVRSLIIELHPGQGYDRPMFEKDLLKSGSDWKLISCDQTDLSFPGQPFVVAAIRLN